MHLLSFVPTKFLSPVVTNRLIRYYLALGYSPLFFIGNSLFPVFQFHAIKTLRINNRLEIHVEM